MKTIKLLIISFLSILFFSPDTFAQASPRINIQGTLKDGSGNALEDGDVSVTFKLYTQSEGGAAAWEETAEVAVFGGVYSHNLGSITPLTDNVFQSTAYLGVTVGNGTELFPRTELTYAPYAISVASTQRVAQGGCSGQVGDIKYSILTPDQFRQENGDCWIPMDGRAIGGSKLAGYGWNNVPDMSGLFMRAAEYNGNNDPDRATTDPIATFQGDEFRSHNHTMQSAGEHSHNVINSNNQGQMIVGDQGSGNTTHLSYSDSNGTYGNIVTNSAGSHTHIINFEGTSSETRPKNMNFYIYIRIN